MNQNAPTTTDTTDAPIRTCAKCSCVVAVGVDRCPSCRAFQPGNTVGRATTFQPGNTASRTHGLRAFSARGRDSVPPDLLGSVDQFRDEVASDLGGVEEMTAIERGYLRRLVDVEICLRLIQADLSKNGVMTPRGRVRGAFSKLLDTINTWDRTAQRLGTARREKRVESFVDAVRAANSEDVDA